MGSFTGETTNVLSAKDATEVAKEDERQGSLSAQLAKGATAPARQLDFQVASIAIQVGPYPLTILAQPFVGGAGWSTGA